MGDPLGETIRITTSGPVIIGAASFWYSITGWEESLLMRDGCAQNLRSRPTRGWGNNQGLSSLSCKLSTVLTGGDRTKKPQDGFRVLGVHWMEIWVLSFQCNPHSDTIQLQNSKTRGLFQIENEMLIRKKGPIHCWKNLRNFRSIQRSSL